MQREEVSHTRPCHRAVLKLGTNILRGEDGRVDEVRLAGVGEAVAGLRARGIEVLIVSSGAIGLGMGKLGMSRRPTRLPDLQACAAIGQTILMDTWQRSFAPYGISVAQILLTREDVRGRRRHVAVLNTLERLLSLGVIPIINENDTVSADEIKFGDNDVLSALVASLVRADLLAILSTAPGLVDRTGTGEIVPVVEEITPGIRAMAGGSETATSVGGMITKLDAADIATASGCAVYIGSGYEPTAISQVIDGHGAGTYFVPSEKGMQGRKRWIAFFQRPRGVIQVDAGARRALEQAGSSLLPKGIVGCEGDWEAGAVVNIREGNSPVGRGVCAYSSEELRRVIGQDSTQIRALFPGRRHFEAIHRDSLVLLH